MESSEIVQFYCGKSVFLTGSTGFIGKLILEKLLRTCNNIDKIYILVRRKTGKNVDERFDALFECPMMEPLKEQNPNYRNKVVALEGDLALPNCGLSVENIKLIQENVDIIIHCGATVRFIEFIKRAAYINVRSVKDLLNIANGMKKLKCFLYVSTAFSHCYRHVIEEKFYPTTMDAEQLLRLVECFKDDDTLSAITPTLLQDWPNTYTFTKAIAENLLITQGKSLPIVVMRPSIVLSSYHDPLPGWIDSFNGPAGIFVGVGLGLLRSSMMDGKVCSDFFPADFVVNATLVAIYDKVEKSYMEAETSGLNILQSVPVYNLSLRPFTPILWEKLYTIAFGNSKGVLPPKDVLWYPSYTPYTCRTIYNFRIFFQLKLPAMIADQVRNILGKKNLRLSDKADKIMQGLETLDYFVTREWEMKCGNTKKLWNSLKENDRKIFNFQIENFNWEEFLLILAFGMRRYLLKDPDSTIPDAKMKLAKLYIAYLILNTISLFVLIGTFYYLLKWFLV